MRSLLEITSSDPIVDTIPVTWLRPGSGQGLCLGLRESRFVVTKAMQKRRCRYGGVALVVLRRVADAVCSGDCRVVGGSR